MAEDLGGCSSQRAAVLWFAGAGWCGGRWEPGDWRVESGVDGWERARRGTREVSEQMRVGPSLTMRLRPAHGLAVGDCSSAAGRAAGGGLRPR